jgi:hypothetical protein
MAWEEERGDEKIEKNKKGGDRGQQEDWQANGFLQHLTPGVRHLAFTFLLLDR